MANWQCWPNTNSAAQRAFAFLASRDVSVGEPKRSVSYHQFGYRLHQQRNNGSKRGFCAVRCVLCCHRWIHHNMDLIWSGYRTSSQYTKKATTVQHHNGQFVTDKPDSSHYHLVNFLIWLDKGILFVPFAPQKFAGPACSRRSVLEENTAKQI